MVVVDLFQPHFVNFLPETPLKSQEPARFLSLYGVLRTQEFSNTETTPQRQISCIHRFWRGLPPIRHAFPTSDSNLNHPEAAHRQ